VPFSFSVSSIDRSLSKNESDEARALVMEELLAEVIMAKIHVQVMVNRRLGLKEVRRQ
jgi:hypothetical protein